MPFLKAIIHINAWSHLALVFYGLIFTLPYETYFSISSKIVIGSIFIYLLLGIYVDLNDYKRFGYFVRQWLSNK
ncbi:hypothetical protein [Piscibacillus halophilus]|uniref:Uncharacterized protein n=1 Tax=Piscibacillus halophilus TaxID=571933 RepID=A0A1H9J421_9BACI|nr:hypothetical protein [Piscibacillus halophilus]SEQ81630.1 hypothetical protein SAMN05216362_12837 [Piscibacillus halophilus]